MKYGVFQFSTDYAIRIDDLARETEGRGFTPTSRSAARVPGRAGPTCRASTGTPSTPSWAWPPRRR